MHILWKCAHTFSCEDHVNRLGYDKCFSPRVTEREVCVPWFIPNRDHGVFEANDAILHSDFYPLCYFTSILKLFILW